MTEQFFWQICKEMSNKINSVIEFNAFSLNTWQFEAKSGFDCSYENELFFNKF